MLKNSGADEYFFQTREVETQIDPEKLASAATFLISIDEDPAILEELILDDTLHRFGKNGRAWYIGNQQIVTIGTWARGNLKRSFRLIDVELSAEEKEKYYRELEIKKLKEEKAREAEYREAAHRAFEGWKQIDPDGELSTYLVNKHIQTNHGAKTLRNGKNLVIPMLNNQGIVGLQTIIFDEEGSQKRFSPGCQKKGSYFLLDSALEDYRARLQGAKLILITEGFATGCSIKEAIPGAEVVCVWDCGNIASAIESIRELNIKCKILICGDRDLKSQAGQRACFDAKAEFQGVYYILPRFLEHQIELSDFNDLHVSRGIEEVRDQINIFIYKFNLKNGGRRD